MRHGHEPYSTLDAGGRPGHYEYLLGRRPDAGEVFRGYGRSTPEERQRTQKLLRRLSARMKNSWLERLGPARPGRTPLDNDRIPAGYTYLGQLIAHDISFAPLAMPTGAQPVSAMRNLSTSILDLDGLYGGGPVKSPALYQVREGDPGLPREKLRIGWTRAVDAMEPAADDLPRVRIDACATNATDGPARPAGCPFGHGAPAAGEAPPLPILETLIADPRNEDNLILAQIAVLFMKFHNAVVDRLRAFLGDGPAAGRIFELARRYVILSYRSVIVNDYLRAVLSPDVWREYCQKSAVGEFRWIAREADRRGPIAVPVELTVGVLRVGHAMVRGEYGFNDTHTAASVRTLLRFNPGAGVLGRELPLGADWIIDWDRFFPKMVDDRDRGYMPAPGRPFTPSQRLAPVMNHVLFQSDDFHPVGGRQPGLAEEDGGGLFYRDFARAYDLGLPNGQTLCKAFGTRPVGRDRLAVALREGDRPHAGLSEAEVVMLADDTPLLYYVLVEAEATAAGEHLGELGSRILAEVVFGILKLTDEPPNAEMTRLRDTVLGVGGIPRSMRDIVDFVGGTRRAADEADDV